ncbi:YitT family protein [Intestinibacter sp.]|uniref:YitT family protein n=1 Tax=Intestinibacter sp. TaxID=1965304 RepID=UPI002A76168A|nr:YitT family protein [Intestinibacter sp.]MDY2736373.1 YitT family protein [Intestinibacter sp.]MDY4573769.1 YitT family protein [Intestinibacter sp.]
MTNQSNNKSLLDQFISFLLITIGATFAAVALEIFLVPNNIIDGGIIGISIMLSYVTKIQLSILTLVLNIPFLILGYKQLGKSFLIKAAYAMVVFSILLEQFKPVEELTNDILLATVFGGVLLGIGVGFVIRYGACLDGTEVVAILISKKMSFSVGQVVMFFNFFIYATASLLFGWDRALYSILTYFITFKIIDMVSEGLEQAKAAMIITNHGEEIANSIYKHLGRTVTMLEGEGLISGKKVVLYAVVTRIEIPELKRIVAADDYSAFVTITDVNEIVGKHIKKKKNENIVD